MEIKSKTIAVRKVLIITFFLNIIVALSKIYYGYQADLISMISDGYHSLMDSSSNIVGLFAIYFSARQPDERFPYGYKKFETFASLTISFLLFVTTFEVIQNILERLYLQSVPVVRIENFLVMIITIFVNLFVAFYEKKRGNELNNKLLKDDSAHTASDIMVSLSVLVSIFAVKKGLVFFDFLVSIFIVFIITKIAVQILLDSISVLSDSSTIDKALLEKIVISVDGVQSCHKIRTRGLSDNVYIDLHIQVDPNISITRAHDIGHQVQDRLKNLEGVFDVIIHVEPDKHFFTK